MEQSAELCRAKHEYIDKEVEEMKSAIGSIKKTLNGGNGDGIGLVARVDKNTDFRVEMQGYLRKINTQFYVIVFLLISIVVGMLRELAK